MPGGFPARQGEGLGCCKGGSLSSMHRCWGEELGALKGTACLPQNRLSSSSPCLMRVRHEGAGGFTVCLKVSVDVETVLPCRKIDWVGAVPSSGPSTSASWRPHTHHSPAITHQAPAPQTEPVSQPAGPRRVCLFNQPRVLRTSGLKKE